MKILKAVLTIIVAFVFLLSGCVDNEPIQQDETERILTSEEMFEIRKNIYSELENSERALKLLMQKNELSAGSVGAIYFEGDTITLYQERRTITAKSDGDNYIVEKVVDTQDVRTEIFLKKVEDTYFIEDVKFGDNREIVVYRPRDNFFDEDKNKDEKYNIAISAYNEYLTQKTEEWFYPKDENTDLRYALFDFDNNGVPELITEVSSIIGSYGYVVSCIDGDFTEWFVPWASKDGLACIMQNGMIGFERRSTGLFYSFQSYNSDGTFTPLELYMRTIDDGKTEYVFDGKVISEEEYNNITQYYLAEIEKEAEIEWVSFYEKYEKIVY